MSERTGFIDFTRNGDTYKTWFKIVGDFGSGRHPLVLLHGGPGLGATYLSDPHLELYTKHDIGPLIFYDQVGCGHSTHLSDKPKEFWTVEFFMDELDNVISHFKIADDFDLYGHSWGGMLAADYVSTRHPKGLRRLIIADSPSSMPLWGKCTTMLLETRYSKEFRDMLRKHEREGTTDDKEYQDGTMTFYKKHICTLDPWPQSLVDSFGEWEKDPVVYQTM